MSRCVECPREAREDSQWCDAHNDCSPAAHDARRASGDVLRLRDWPDAGLVIGECPRCSSTLAIREVSCAA